ncbi:MAG: hypothetical protein ACHQ49_15090, partial [Elusimicrobiota bacterium]
PAQPKPAAAAQSAPATAETACAEALKDHPDVAKMCKDHSDIAPILGGMLDALKDQFGSLGAVAMNIGFMLVGLALSALSGFGLVAKIAVSLVSFAMLVGTIYPLIKKGALAALDLARTKAEDVAHAKALVSIGQVGGSVLIMGLMVALGWGAGKTNLGKNASGAMTDAIASKFEQLGLKDTIASLDAKIPPAVKQFFGGAPAKAPGAKSGPAAAAEGAQPETIRRSAKSKALVDERTVLDNARIKERSARIDQTMKQLGVDREFAGKVADAHESVPCAVGDCTKAQLRAKMDIMGEGPKRGEAIRRGLAGNAPAGPPPALRTIDPASLPEAGLLRTPEEWSELSARSPAGAKAVMNSKSNASAANPILRVELADGEKVSGGFLGLDGDKMVFESEGKLVGLDRNHSGVTKVSRLADVVFENGDRSPAEVVLHDQPALVVDPFKDLAAYKGRVVDIDISDLDDPQFSRQTVTGRIVKVDGETVLLEGPKGPVRVQREYHQIDSVAQHSEHYASRGKIAATSDLNGAVPGGTPVELALRGEKSAKGLFRGVHQDSEGQYVLLETPNGTFRGYRDIVDLRTTGPSAGGALPGGEVLYARTRP